LNEIIYNTEPSYFNDDTDLIIETGTSGFINEVLSPTSGLTLSTKDYAAVKSIEERRLRLTENDFILDQLHVYKTTKTDLLDNTFYLFKTKIESAGSLLSFISNTTNQVQNKTENISSSI
jgi:predicted nucleic-acid-binding protein